MSVSIESPLEFEPLSEEEIQKILASEPISYDVADYVHAPIPKHLLQLNDRDSLARVFQ